MQVALATLWSCFPVSASGADVLLFSLLHTSSGSCCSPETNHGLLRSSRSPLFFLSLSLSLCFFESSLSLSPYCFFFPLSQVLSISLSLSYSLCFPLVTPKQPSLSMGIQDAQGKERGQDLSEAALSGEKERERGDLSLSSTPPHSVFLSVQLFPWKRCSQSSPPTLNLYLLYLFNCWCLAEVFREFFFLLCSSAADPQCGLQIRSCRVILLLLCGNTVQTFPISLLSQMHYQAATTETWCLLWWIQYLKKLSSLCKLIFIIL